MRYPPTPPPKMPPATVAHYTTHNTSVLFGALFVVLYLWLLTAWIARAWHRRQQRLAYQRLYRHMVERLNESSVVIGTAFLPIIISMSVIIGRNLRPFDWAKDAKEWV